MKIQLKSRPISGVSCPSIELAFNTIEESNKASDILNYTNRIPSLEYAELFKLGDTIILNFPNYSDRAIFIQHHIKFEEIEEPQWWLDLTEEKETKMEEKKNKRTEITLRQFLELIDFDYPNNKNEFVEIVEPDDDGWDVYVCFPISSYLLVPFYDVGVITIEASAEHVMRVELSDESFRNVVLNNVDEDDES